MGAPIAETRVSPRSTRRTFSSFFWNFFIKFRAAPTKHQSVMPQKPVIRNDTPGHVNNVFAWHEHQNLNDSGEAPAFVKAEPEQSVKKGRRVELKQP